MKIKIEDLIKHNPIIWSNQEDIFVDSNNLNIFLGGGVATKTKISQAVPFDLLGFVLTAEQIKRITRGKVHMLIADQHAWLANNLDRAQATRAATNLNIIVTRIVRQFNFTDWHIHFASKLFSNQPPTNYENLEVRDIDHFTRKFQCNIKLGWTFSPKETGITDESHFDKFHNLSTVLIKPGLTDSPAKPHESPYICTDPSMRIIFANSNNWQLSPAIKNHLQNICLLFENIVKPFPPKTPVEEKCKIIINQVLKTKV
jgi:hypothetical protein